MSYAAGRPFNDRAHGPDAMLFNDTTSDGGVKLYAYGALDRVRVLKRALSPHNPDTIGPSSHRRRAARQRSKRPRRLPARIHAIVDAANAQVSRRTNLPRPSRRSGWRIACSDHRPADIPLLPARHHRPCRLLITRPYMA